METWWKMQNFLKVNQPQIPQAYQCNLLEKCCHTSGRSWHANPFPNPNCNKLGNNSNVSLSVKHVLNKIWIAELWETQTCLHPAASEAKSLTVGRRQGHRPAFHQNNPSILVKNETDSSMSPVNVLEGNFGLTRPSSDWPVLSLESLQVAATRSGLCVLRTMQLLQRRRHRAGWKFCGSRGGEHMSWQGSMISRSRQRAASLNLQHRTPWYQKQKDRNNYSIRLSDQKLFLLQNLDAWIYSEDVHWWNSTEGDQHFLSDIALGTPKSTSSDYQPEQCPAGTTSFMAWSRPRSAIDSSRVTLADASRPRSSRRKNCPA